MVSVHCDIAGGDSFDSEIFDGGDEYYFIGATIPVEAGQDVTCTFRNEPQTGYLTIIKEASAADPGHPFAFFGDLGEFDLTPDESQRFLLPIGMYRVVEDSRSVPNQKWDLVSVYCQGDDFEFYPEIFNGGDNYYFTGVEIQTLPAMDIQCRFLNEPANLEEDPATRHYLPLILKGTPKASS